jgi:hypothetical protein
MYCGTSLGDQLPADAKQASVTWGKTIVFEKDGKTGSGVSMSVDESVYEKLGDIPEPLRRGIEEILREGGKSVFVEERTVSSTSAESEPGAPFAATSPEKIVDTLTQMKQWLDDGQIDHPIYKATVIGIMKDFIDSFPEDLKLKYVVNEIIDSPLAPFVDDKIHNELIKYFVSRAAGTNKE